MMGRTPLDPRWHVIREDGSPFPGEQRPPMVTLRTGQPCSDVVMGVYSAEGSLSWVLVNSRPILRPGEPRPGGVVVTLADITARKHAEEETRRQIIRAEALAHLAMHLNAHADIPMLLDEVCAETAHALHLPTAMVSLYDTDRDLFYTAAAWGAARDLLLRHPAIPRAVLEPFLSRAEAAWIIPDLQALPNLGAAQVEVGQNMGAAAVARLEHEGRLIGMLSVPASVGGRVFSVDDLTLLRALGNLAAAAVADAQLLEQIRLDRQQLADLSRQLVEVQEAERRYVARELHDEIGQALTGLQLMLATLPDLPPEAAERLQTARNLADDLSEQVHDLSLDLRPSILDDLGLLPTLVWHFQRYGDHTGITINFAHDGLNRRFPAPVETAAYRIVQEALTNIARHAHVQEAAVRVWADGETLNVQVEDLGAGFDEQSIRRGGLSGMRERAALLGGDFTLTTAPGAGTMFLAALPLSEAGPTPPTALTGKPA
jgi:signal transduction histidine kinase